MWFLTALSGASVVPGGDLGAFVAAGLLGAGLLDRFRDDGAADGADGGSLLGDSAFGRDGDGEGDDVDGSGGSDERGDPAGGGADATDLETRIGNLEREVAALSSTVNADRSANEAVSGRVTEIAEDVRRLLDIYETVARDSDAPGGGVRGGRGGDLAPPEAETAAADGDGFDDGGAFGDGLDGLGDAGDGGIEGDDDTAETAPAPTASGDRKSSSELRDQCESGDADWTDAGGRADEAFDADEPSPDDPTSEAATTGAVDPGSRPSDADEGGFEFVGADDLSPEPRKPYLTALPGDYVGDLLVMEWLEYLVEESDVTDAVRAVNYYERIEWIDEGVADRLREFLSGFGDVDRNRVDEPGTAQLTLDHHARSLNYVVQLTNATAESVVIDRWPGLSGEVHGSRR